VRVLTFGLMLCALLGCGDGLPDRSASTSEISAPPVPDAPLSSTDSTEPQPTAPPADTDGDGVIDMLDRCAGTEQGKQVDAVGCAIDPDDDGIVGPTDLCPDSPYGEPVDATGCRPRLAVAQEYTLLLTFENASAKIVGDPRGALAEVAALITQYRETTVVIEGHTDDRGTASYNMKLSKRRAEAVANVLVTDLGIDAARVSTKAFGESRPIATNATKEGRERNRRVVAVVLPGKPLTPVAANTAEHSQ
jgi:OOP family OmpA-OmpF porin